MTHLQCLAKAIRENLSDPFLWEGFVKVHCFFDKDTNGGMLNIAIGDRDFTLNENFTCIGSGSRVGDATQWKIEKQ